jgi:hypothetical protein
METLWWLILIVNLTGSRDSYISKAHFWVCLWGHFQRQLQGRIHPKCGQHHPIHWGLGETEGKRRSVEHRHSLSLFPSHHEVSSFPLPWYTVTPEVQKHGTRLPWTVLLKLWAITNPSSFTSFSWAFYHISENLANSKSEMIGMENACWGKLKAKLVEERIHVFCNQQSHRSRVSHLLGAHIPLQCAPKARRGVKESNACPAGFSLVLVPSLFSLPLIVSFRMGMFTLWHCILEVYSLLFLLFCRGSQKCLPWVLKLFGLGLLSNIGTLGYKLNVVCVVKWTGTFED